MRAVMVRVGNFFFRYRNALFPLIVVGLYAVAVPPDMLLGSATLETLKDTLALGLVLAGLGLRAAVIGFAYIKRGGVNKQIYAARLVTEGLFRLCRNPIYTGNMLIVVGVFLVHGNPWVFAGGTLFFWFVYASIIAAEETYLRDRFGAEYDAYCRDVPRWIPRLSRWHEATADMQFSFRRVLAKDYGTIALTLSTLCLEEIYEAVSNADLPGAWARQPEYLSALVATIVLLGAMTLTISRMKKAGHFRERDR
jgi:protein-S-isoprenylcysteine O-methyltransferase Ste14